MIHNAPLVVKEKENALDLINRTTSAVRTISHNLIPEHFENRDLTDILRSYFEQLNSKSDINFVFSNNGTPAEFTKEKELMIYRIVLELVNNCAKHSMAKTVTMELTYGRDNLEISCEDDGVGFKGNSDSGLGLRSIKSRVLFLSGTFSLTTNDKGTKILIVVPLKIIAISLNVKEQGKKITFHSYFSQVNRK